MNEKENTCSIERSKSVGRPFGQKKQALSPISATNLSNGPILLCQSSGDPLMIGFGCVKVGSETERVVNVFNPSRVVPADVKLDRKSSSVKGLKVYFEGKTAAQTRIPPMGSETLHVSWKPDCVASLTEMIELKLNNSGTLIVTVTGIAAQAEVAVTPMAPSGITKCSVPLTIADLHAPVPEAAVQMQMTTEIITIKREESIIREAHSDVCKPRADRYSSSSSLSRKITGAHRGTTKKENGVNFRPTIKSTVFDNFWAEKQEAAFLNWLNFTLSGAGPSPSAAVDRVESLTQKRLTARQRQSVVDLYNSDGFTETVDAVMKEVFERRLQIREDRDINSDVGLRECFVNLLLCYDQDWLRTCLEVVCGESIHSYYVDKMQKKADLLSGVSICEEVEHDISMTGAVKPRVPVPAVSTKGSWKTQVKTFILDKMVDDAIVRQRYNSLSSFTQEKQLKDELSQYTICKFLSLISLLDTSRERGLLSSSVLFCRSAPFKSSKEILIEFCKSFLKGEGDIIRHLGLLGFEVKYVQTYLDEFDYSVQNVATDLRDGVRLSRIAEIITASSDRSLRNILRVPAISRLQKLHNVQQALLYLNTRSVGNGATFDIAADAKSIVDGHREGTLLALWKLIYGYEMLTSVDAETVYAEAVRIEFTKGCQCLDGSLDVSVGASDPLMPLYQSVGRWCRAVLYPKHISIDNFTSSFADNIALCRLVSYYRPDLLSASAISNYDSEDSVMESFSKKESLKMERQNYALLCKACHAIGGVPMLLQACDSKNVPDEKTMLYFLTILYKRLIESHKETVASVVIQRRFRNFMQSKRPHAAIKSLKSEVRRRHSAAMTVRPSVLVAARRRHSTSDVSRTSSITVNVSKRTLAASKINAWIIRMLNKSSVAAIVKSSKTVISEADDFLPSMNMSMSIGDHEYFSQQEIELQLLREQLAESKRIEAERHYLEEMQRQAELSKLRMEMEARLAAEEARGQMEAQRLTDEARAIEANMQQRLRDEYDREELMRQQAWQQIEEERREKEEIERQRQQEVLRLQTLYEAEISQRVAVEAAVAAANSERQLLSAEHERDVEAALDAAMRDREESERALSEGARTALEEERNARLALEQQLLEMKAEKERVRLQLLELEAIKMEADRKAKIKELKSVSATRIQSFARCWLGKRRYAAMKRAVVSMQAMRRAGPVRSAYRQKIGAITIMQRVFRQYIRHRDVTNLWHCSAVIVQNCIRRYLSRQRVQRMNALVYRTESHSAFLLQQWWKRYMAARESNLRMHSATRLQAVFRRFLVERNLSSSRNAASLIQKAYQKYVMRIKETQKFQSRREDAKRRQTATRVLRRFGIFVMSRRMHIRAVAIISRWVVAYRPLLRIRILKKGFTRLQAFFRAYKIRCRSAKAVKKARIQIRAAEDKSRSDPTQRLGHLTRNALRTLKKGKMISQIYKACHTLDTATRFSIKCCGAFTSAGATKALLNLIRSCNRSTPHQEILRLSISILLNVVRHAQLAVVVAVDFDGTDVVIDLMQMFRDKGIIFNSACELLGYMVQASHVIKNLCNHTELRKRIDGIFHIMERKNRLDARIQAATKKAAAPKSEISSFTLIQKLMMNLN